MLLRWESAEEEEVEILVIHSLMSGEGDGYIYLDLLQRSAWIWRTLSLHHSYIASC